MSKSFGGSEEQSHSGIFYRALALLFVSGMLLLLDARVEQVQVLRRSLEYALTPAYLTLNFLVKQHQLLDSYLSFNRKQFQELETLRVRNVQLETRIAIQQSFERENIELRRLLNYYQNQTIATSLIGQVIGQKINSRLQEIVLDKGTLAGVRERYAVTTNQGLLGQIVLTNLFSSRLLLATDIRHATPVMVARNRHRFILHGTGDSSRMVANDVDSNVDVDIGDLLVTSGLGDVFPAGIPIAEVTSMDLEQSRSFRQVRARFLVNPYATQFVLIIAKEGAGE